MTNQNNRNNIIGPLIIVLAIVIYAFSQGFWEGVNLLGEIVNIFGTVFVWVFKLIFSIPQVAEEFFKRIVTTLLVWGLSIWWCVEDYKEQQIVKFIAKIATAVLITVLSWIGLF